MIGSLHSKSHNARQFSLDGTAREICVPSDRRTGIIIAPPVRGTVYIGNDSSITVGNGIPIKSIDQPLYLGIENVGDMVKRGLWAVGNSTIGDVGGQVVAYEANRASAAAPGAAAASIAPAATNHIRVESIHANVNVNEVANFTFNDSALTTYVDGFCMQSINYGFNPPLVIPTGLTAVLTIAQSATSTAAYASVIGKEYFGASTLVTAVNLTVVEIFACDYTPNVDQIMANMRG